LLQKVYSELGQEEHSIPELHGRTKISTAFPNPDDESVYVIVKRPSRLPPGASALTSSLHYLIHSPVQALPDINLCCLCAGNRQPPFCRPCMCANHRQSSS
jgi:hypothetical protein